MKGITGFQVKVEYAGVSGWEEYGLVFPSKRFARISRQKVSQVEMVTARWCEISIMIIKVAHS